MENQGIQLPVTKVPASEAKPGGALTPTSYPILEEMTFKGIIKSEAEGYALLSSIQAIVNEFGAEPIIKLVDTLRKNPELLAKAKTYIPLL